MKIFNGRPLKYIEAKEKWRGFHILCPLKSDADKYQRFRSQRSIRLDKSMTKSITQKFHRREKMKSPRNTVWFWTFFALNLLFPGCKHFLFDCFSTVDEPSHWVAASRRWSNSNSDWHFFWNWPRRRLVDWPTGSVTWPSVLFSLLVRVDECWRLPHPSYALGVARKSKIYHVRLNELSIGCN